MSPYEFSLEIINALAPLSRRDDWWSTDSPAAAIEGVVMRAQQKHLERLTHLEKVSRDDPESSHSEADDAICQVLIAMGCEAVVDRWKNIAKWYA